MTFGEYEINVVELEDKPQICLKLFWLVLFVEGSISMLPSYNSVHFLFCLVGFCVCVRLGVWGGGGGGGGGGGWR